MRPEPLPTREAGRRVVRHALGAEFEEAGVVLVDEGDVEPVEPGHGLVGVVMVAVKVPAGRQ